MARHATPRAPMTASAFRAQLSAPSAREAERVPTAQAAPPICGEPAAPSPARRGAADEPHAAQAAAALALARHASAASPSRVGADLIDAAVPLATRHVEDCAWETWTTFRAHRGEPPSFAADAAPRDVEDVLCTFLLTVFYNMRPRSRKAAVPKPSSAEAVVNNVRRKHARDYFPLAATPRVAALVKALGVGVAKADGPEALMPARKAPLTLEIILNVRAKADGLVIGDRTVDEVLTAYS
jgi:hypothetical protein